jgi:drug/metabolite transporter (DMT)-like permease
VPSPDEPRRPAPAWLVWAALAVIYLVWGSTYLFIRIAVQTMPPLLTAGARFVLAGLIIYGVLALRGGPRRLRLTRAELLGSTLVGAALITGGNGLVMLAERDVASGLAALIIGSEPLWIIVFRRLAGERVGAGTLVGVVVGFAGVALLVLPSGSAGGAQALGVLLLVLAAASWATGSFFSQRVALPRDPLLSTAVQMITGGLLVTAAGVLAGELVGLDPSTFSRESLLSVGYLLVFGSLLAFTAYTWLLQNAPIQQVSTYAYVNPVVAVLLGWLVLAESITPVILGGAALIVASVAFVVRQESSARRVVAESPAIAATASSDGS